MNEEEKEADLRTRNRGVSLGGPGPGSVSEVGGHGGPLQNSLASGTAGAGASWAVGLGHTRLLNLPKSQGPAGVSGQGPHLPCQHHVYRHLVLA